MLDIKKELLRLSEVEVISTKGEYIGVVFEIRYCGFYLGAIDRSGEINFLPQAKKSFNLDKDVEKYLRKLKRETTILITI